MIHLKIADKTLLVSEQTADLLMAYAALLGRISSADDVHLTALGFDGSTVEATLLLNSGTVLVAETTHSEVPEPENAEANAYLRDRLASYGDPGEFAPQQVDPFAVKP